MVSKNIASFALVRDQSLTSFVIYYHHQWWDCGNHKGFKSIFRSNLKNQSVILIDEQKKFEKQYTTHFIIKKITYKNVYEIPIQACTLKRKGLQEFGYCALYLETSRSKLVYKTKSGDTTFFSIKMDLGFS